MRITLLTLLCSACALLAPGVQGEESPPPAPGATTWISMEGQTWDLSDFDRRRSKAEIVDGDFRFYLASEASPIEINFNLPTAGSLDSGSAVFVLPRDNQDRAAVDLNFFNKDRAGSRMKRRIIFDEGTIEITEISTEQLRMTFKGSGHPLMDPTRFPIEGAIDAGFRPAD